MCHVAQLTGYTFTDKIDMGEWPTFLLPILNCQQDTADRDKMMLGALDILSGIIPKSLYGSNGYGSKGSSLDCSSSNGNGGCWSPSRLF